LCERANRRIGAVRFAFCDDRLRVVLSHALDVLEPDTDAALLDVAADAAAVDVGRARLDVPPLRVAHERRRWIEAHRLRVQERREELGAVVVTQPRRLVREQAERRRVRLREAEARERDELVVDEMRELLVDALRERAGHHVPVTYYGAKPENLEAVRDAGADRALIVLETGPEPSIPSL